MKTHFKSNCLLVALLLGLSAGTLHAQYTPVTCGAVSTNAGSKLKFVNGANFSADSGFVQPLTYTRIANRYGTNNYYTSSNLLFTALSVRTNAATSAAAGSYVACQIVTVSGPPGGVLSYWEQGNGRPTYEFPANGIIPTGKNRFTLGNCQAGAGNPGGDPFGSIRGRRFVVNKAGEYTVTFKLVDISQNHPTLISPVHAPSDPLTIKFSTKVDMDITRLSVTNDVATLVFRQGLLTNMYVETATDLASPVWTTVAGPFATAPTTLTTTTTRNFTNNPGAPAIFYRLRGVEP